MSYEKWMKEGKKKYGVDSHGRRVILVKMECGSSCGPPSKMGQKLLVTPLQPGSG